jgi:uncharacterized protein
MPATPQPPKPPVAPIVQLVRLMAQHDIASVVAMVQGDPSLLQEPVPATDHHVPGDTLMHIAAFYAQTPLIDLFRSCGLDVDVRNPLDGFTPLMRAAKRGYSSTITDLLDRGAELEARNSAGGTALHVSASAQRGDATRTLLEAGADPNAIDDRGLTPLVASMCHLNRTNPSTAETLTGDPRTSAGGADAKGNDAVALALLQEQKSNSPEIRQRFNKIAAWARDMKSLENGTKKLMRPLAFKKA